MGHFNAIVRLDGRAIAAVEKAIHAARVPRLVGPRSPAADRERMRAIPVIARSVGGAIPGTKPHTIRYRGDEHEVGIPLPPFRGRDREAMDEIFGDPCLAEIDNLDVLRSGDVVTIRRRGESALSHAHRHRLRVRAMGTRAVST
jgi:hypothetical protein